MNFSLPAIAFAAFCTTEQLEVCRLFRAICPHFLLSPAFEARHPYLHHQNIKCFNCTFVGVFLNEVWGIFIILICFAEASRIPSGSCAAPAAVRRQKNGNRLSPRKFIWADSLNPPHDPYTASSSILKVISTQLSSFSGNKASSYKIKLL